MLQRFSFGTWWHSQTANVIARVVTPAWSLSRSYGDCITLSTGILGQCKNRSYGVYDNQNDAFV